MIPVLYSKTTDCTGTAYSVGNFNLGGKQIYPEDFFKPYNGGFKIYKLEGPPETILAKSVIIDPDNSCIPSDGEYSKIYQAVEIPQAEFLFTIPVVLSLRYK